MAPKKLPRDNSASKKHKGGSATFEPKNSDPAKHGIEHFWCRSSPNPSQYQIKAEEDAAAAATHENVCSEGSSCDPALMTPLAEKSLSCMFHEGNEGLRPQDDDVAGSILGGQNGNQGWKSPETRVSVNFDRGENECGFSRRQSKRLKKSPAVFIKQSQDDCVDEVKFKKTPVRVCPESITKRRHTSDQIELKAHPLILTPIRACMEQNDMSTILQHASKLNCTPEKKSDNISKKRSRKAPEVDEVVIINQESMTKASHATIDRRYQLRSSMNEKDKEATHIINEFGGENTRNEANDALANKKATSRRYKLRSSMNEKDKEATHSINEFDGENTRNEAKDALANEEGVHVRSSHTSNIEHLKKRGPARCEAESSNTNKVEIICNVNGQPIGENSTKFASHLGVIVREMVSITHATWKAVSMEVKNQLWTLIMQKYIVSDAMKKWVFTTMDKQWRDHKHRLVKNYYDKYDNDVDRIANPPPRVSQKDWEAFVNGKNNIDFKAVRQRNKQNRSHQSIMHTCSRRGYARLEHEMRKSQPNVKTPLSRAIVWMEAHKKKNGAPISLEVAETIKKMVDAMSFPSSINESIKDDALTKVLGPERSGRVRGVGKGVSLTALSLGEGYIQKLRQMQEHMVEKDNKLKEKLAEKDKKIEEILSQLSQTEAASLLVTLAIGHNISGGVQSTSTNSIPSRPESSMGLKTTLITQTERRECYLTQIHKDNIVAEGTVISTNPEDFVHGERLGEGYWKVDVHIAHKEETILFRRNDDMATMKDVVGSFIAWPISDIVYK